MNWTKDKPTKPGIFLLWEPGPLPMALVRIEENILGGGGFVGQDVRGGLRYHDSAWDEQWWWSAEPIPEPPKETP